MGYPRVHFPIDKRDSFPVSNSNDETQEGWRKAALQVLAGITTAWLSSAAIPKGVGIPNDWTGTLALGLLASGGSGFWNSILTHVTKSKDLKAAEAESRQIEARAKRTSLSKSGH
jgi:hypothetical protein